MSEENLPGPIDFVVIEFPEGAATEKAAAELTALVDAGIVRIFDIALVRPSGDSGERIDLAVATEGAGRGFESLAGAQSGLFDDDDIAEASSILDAGTTGLLVAWENAWASGFVTAAHGAGGEVVASDRIPAQVLIEALDAAEASD